MQTRTRIAPSPTGIAHLGTAYTALRNWALAKQNNGKFIIRVEDTDQDRYVKGSIEVVFEALSWLGLDNDEGPRKGGPHAPYTQSERLDIYQRHAQILIEKGKAYHCFCSKDRLEKIRKEKQKMGELPRYDLHCRNLTPSQLSDNLEINKPYVIRLKVPRSGVTICNDLVRGKVSFANSGIDDQVIIKSDGFPTYHLAVVVDDHLMEISHIIRGEEWLSSVPKHILLYQAFGWELPLFAHIPIIRNLDKSKMSKRKNDVSILSYKEKGYLPQALNNFLALLGWSHPEKLEVFDMNNYVKSFSLDRITKTAPIFDLDKLNWLNGIYIRNLSDAKLLSALKPFIPANCSPKLAKKILPLIKERLVTLKDFEELTSFFYREISFDRSLLLKKGATVNLVKSQLSETRTELKKIEEENWTHENIEQAIRSIAGSKQWKPGQYFMMLRIALTGRKATPPLFETIEVLGKDLTLTRLRP